MNAGEIVRKENREEYTKISFSAEFPTPSTVYSIYICGVNEYIIMELINYWRPEAPKDRKNIIKTMYEKNDSFYSSFREM